jgi:hypothetical protein
MKNHHHNGSRATAKGVLHEAIAVRAYEIWLGRGKPDHQTEEIWLEAECEQVTGRRAAQTDPILPVSF